MRPLQVRTIAPEAVARVAEASPAGVAATADRVAEKAPAATRAALRPVPRRTAVPPAADRDRPRQIASSAQLSAPAPPSAVAAIDPAADDALPPVYRTRLPPPLTLHYDVRRGRADGIAELHWRLADGGYLLDWQIRVGDAAVLTQSSRGVVDAAGVAPVRFVDQRPSRAAAAVNFQRDIGRISFSRKAADAVLVPGAQDRLSWLLQLAAIVAAEPELRRAGAEIRIAVAGAGGEAAVWRFRGLGEAPVERDGAPALHFVREPGGPYDTRVDVWLDPTGGRYLPLRASWRSGPADEGFDLRMREAVDASVAE